MKSKKTAMFTCGGFYSSELAWAFAEKNYDLILVNPVEQLPRQIAQQFNIAIHELSINFNDDAKCATELKGHHELFSTVDVLVNANDLFCEESKFLTTDFEQMSRMVDLNIKTLLFASKAIAPFMIEKGRGHIVLLGSSLGRWPKGQFGIYEATKSSVNALAENLRMDLHKTGVRVTLLQPEPPTSSLLTAKDVARSTVWSVERPQHVNIQEIVFTSNYESPHL